MIQFMYRLAVSEELLSSLFSVWIQEGKRYEIAKNSKGISSSIQEINQIPVSSSLITIIPSSLPSFFHTHSFSFFVNQTYLPIKPYMSLRWLYDLMKRYSF